jgi:hypothetical protein
VVRAPRIRGVTLTAPQVLVVTGDVTRRGRRQRRQALPALRRRGHRAISPYTAAKAARSRAASLRRASAHTEQSGPVCSVPSPAPREVLGLPGLEEPGVLGLARAEGAGECWACSEQ